MNSQNSSVSDFQSPNKTNAHALCSQLENFGFSTWKKEEINSSISIGDQSNQDNSIIESKTPKASINEPSLDLQQESKNTDKVDEIQISPQQNNQRQQSEDTGSNPQTLTLISDQLLSRSSFNMSSRISQYNSEVDHESYGSFLSILESSYEVILKNFSVLFQSLDNVFSDRFNKIESIYLEFLKLKHHQNKTRLSGIKMLNLGSRNMKSGPMYLDCEGTAGQIHKNISEEVKGLEEMTEIISQNIKSLSKTFSTLNNIKSKRSKEINFMDKKLRDIAEEMTDLMIPKNRKKKKKDIDHQIFVCSYVRTKYLITKEKTFLTTMAQYLKTVLNFITYLCLDAQPKLNLTIKEVLIAFADGVKELRPEEYSKIAKNVQLLQRIQSFKQTYTESIKILQLCVPISILPQNSMKKIIGSSIQEGQKLHKIIQLLIKQSESLIYLPCLETDPKDYYYSSKQKLNVYWKRENNQNVHVQDNESQLEEALLIVTTEGYLVIQIIENGQECEKIALLKLNQLKIGRRKNEIVISHKGKGVLGYLLSSNAILGTLQFQPFDNSKNIEGDRNFFITEFINKVKEILSIQKGGNKTQTEQQA